MIDLIGTLRRLVASVTTIGTTTTTIAADVANIDGEAMRGTDNATLIATWTDAMATALTEYTAARAGYLDELAAANVPADIDTILTRWSADLATALASYTAVRAGYLDELAAANIPSDLDDTLDNVAAVAHRFDSRARVYPQDTQVTASLAAGFDTYDTWGDWTEVIPISTVDFVFEVVGVVIEQASVAATYHVQLGYSTVAESTPTTAQTIGERRFRLIDTPIRIANEKLDLYSFAIPANAKVWGRVKTEHAAPDTLDISVVVLRYTAITNPIAPLTTWPWST